MTTEERAEKIVKIFMGYEKAQNKSFYDQVLLEIEEVQKEATDRLCTNCFKNGWNDAREKAAKKMWECYNSSMNPAETCEAIRAMESDK